MKDGRIISGKVSKSVKKTVDGVQTTFWHVELEKGTLVQISERELASPKKPDGLSDEEKAYEQKLLTEPPKTADDHCEMAGWCAKEKLRKLQLAHYMQALDLEPDHPKARAGAGFARDRNGDWKLRAEIEVQEKGMVLVGRKSFFPEDIAVLEKQKQQAAELAPIKKKMNAMHTAIAFGKSADRRQQALNQLALIQDPREATLLAGYVLDKHRKSPTNVRLLYIKILEKFPNVIPELTNLSLNDDAQVVRDAARDALRKLDAKSALPTLMGYLGNSSNETVNRAARGIEVFKPSEAVLPLIEALVTTHEEQLRQRPVIGAGALGLGPNTKTVRVEKQNAGVRRALTAITAQDFGYDKQQWLAWYSSRNAPKVADTRRDP